MPRRNGHVPAYRLHKPSGQARVIVGGQHVYLGPYGSPESRERYARLVAELPASAGARREINGEFSRIDNVSLNEVILRYWEFAQSYYTKDGKPTKELACMREALRPLRQLYGRTAAAEFGPKALKTVRQRLVEQDLCRNVVNHRISRIKRVFKWAVAEELIPAPVHHGLQAVAGLRYGRTKARETEPVRPVADEWVEALLPFLTPTLAAMVRVQRLTGMRPCELVLMRGCDIDRVDEVWTYEPHDHKMRWRGHRRLVPIGPKAQRVLQLLLDRPPDAYLFSPQRVREITDKVRKKCAHLRRIKRHLSLLQKKGLITFLAKVLATDEEPTEDSEPLVYWQGGRWLEDLHSRIEEDLLLVQDTDLPTVRINAAESRGDRQTTRLEDNVDLMVDRIAPVLEAKLLERIQKKRGPGRPRSELVAERNRVLRDLVAEKSITTPARRVASSRLAKNKHVPLSFPAPTFRQCSR